MGIKEWVMVSAVIAGPILAVQAQRILDSIRYKKQKRLEIFHTLMATRATRLSIEHVAALNRIDLEFYGRKILGIRLQTPKEKSVTNSWKNYNDKLNEQYAPDQIAIWSDSRDNLFTKLLYTMSQAQGYDFDEVQLKRDCYRPIGHGDLELQQDMIRRAVLEILNGDRALPIVPFETTSDEETTNNS